MAMTTLDETAELVRAVVRQLGGRFSTELGIDVDADDAEIGRRHTDPRDLASALDDLPGWGPVTVGLFLRELRGVWPGARVPLDAQVVEARPLDLARREAADRRRPNRRLPRAPRLEWSHASGRPWEHPQDAHLA